jgi:hypothetical protein
MTDLTAKKIISFLPFPDDYKKTLLGEYDSLPKEEQLRISDIVWEFYFDYYQLKIQENFNKGIVEANEKGEQLGESYYEKVIDQTQEEMDQLAQSSGETADLSEARTSMERIIREINAAKIPIKQ